MYGSDTAIGSFSQSYSDDSLWKSIHRDNSEEQFIVFEKARFTFIHNVKGFLTKALSVVLKR